MHQIRRLALLLVAFTAVGCGSDGDYGPIYPIDPPNPGEKSFVTAEPGEDDPSSYGGGADAGVSASADASSAPSDDSGAPSGRDAEVEEAEIYRVHDDKLFFLNTYRGLLIYDIKDEANPTLLSRLGVYGVPIEMYFQGDIAFVLIKDALYLTQTAGAPASFQRHNVSQLLTVDFKDPKAPKIIARFDIEGLLREGLSRKVDNTLYVVTEKPSWYYSSGWYGKDNYGKEEAHVHSFDVSDPRQVVEVDRLQLLSGGGENDGNWQDGWDSRSFLGVAISATSNALMVAERWQVWSNSSSGSWCNERYNETRVSVVDISDPSGQINVHTRFARRGDLSDQFKQTYIYEEDKQRGVYLGIFARNEWTDCTNELHNSITSIDISDGQNPTELSTLAFGKVGETVRGSLFDQSRKVAYAITVFVQQARDPLYAIDISNLDKLEVLSEIDGLSGDINVFRPIGDKGQFLLTVGRDASNACQGFEDTDWAPTRVAVSIFDAHDLNALKLVQRRCVALDRARWSSSSVNSDLDQAHKMIGMYSDAEVNLVAVPVSYYEETRDGENDWWWYSWRSAVGMMSWDLTRYDPALAPEQQTVLQDLATVVHPNGEVKRTIFIQRPGPNDTKRRVMLTLSETHMAFNDVTDLSRPLLQSSVEVAPFSAGVYRLGANVVEQIAVGGSSWGYWYGSYYDRRPTLFKVKRPAADGALGDETELSRFTLVGVQKVMSHGDNALIVVRGVADYGQELLIIDLSDPTNPRRAGRVRLDDRYYWGSYYNQMAEGIARGAFDTGYYERTIKTKAGLALLEHDWKWDGEESIRQSYLSVIDLRNLEAPKLIANKLAIYGWGEVLDLVADDSDGERFYLNVRKKVGTAQAAGIGWDLYRHNAVPYRLAADKLETEKEVNLPGRLVRAFEKDGQRVIVSRDNRYARIPDRDYDWCASCNFAQLPRLHLLTQNISGGSATLKDSLETSQEYRVYGAGITNERLYLHVTNNWYFNDGTDYFERLMPYEISAQGFTAGAPISFDGGFTLLHVGNQRPMLSLDGDGVLTLDGRDVNAIRGLRFSRTLGWTHNAAMLPPHGYVAAGNFGTQHIPLDVLPTGTQL